MNKHPAGLAGLVHRDDVRILDRRGRLRLPDKPAPEILIGRQRRAEDLQRDQAVQPLITRPEHHRHPARTHLLLQQVPGNPRARSKTGQHTAGLPAQPLTHPPLHGREPPNSGPGHPRDNNQPLPGPTPQWHSKYPGHPPPPQPKHITAVRWISCAQRVSLTVGAYEVDDTVRHRHAGIVGRGIEGTSTTEPAV